MRSQPAALRRPIESLAATLAQWVHCQAGMSARTRQAVRWLRALKAPERIKDVPIADRSAISARNASPTAKPSSFPKGPSARSGYGRQRVIRGNENRGGSRRHDLSISECCNCDAKQQTSLIWPTERLAPHFVRLRLSGMTAAAIRWRVRRTLMRLVPHLPKRALMGSL